MLEGCPRSRDGFVRPLTFALSSALAGSMCVVQAKSMSELVELIFSTDGFGPVLGDWLFWFDLSLLFVFLFTWLSRLNAALAKYDPLFIIPLVQVRRPYF